MNKNPSKQNVWVLGDVHGRCKELKQVLKKSNFNKEEDKLIVLGDIVDGGPDTYGVVEELLTIKNMVFIEGNHDRWWKTYLETGDSLFEWHTQGGKTTKESYAHCNGIIPVTHQDFFNRSVPYHEETINGKKCLFVHGGYNPDKPIRVQDPKELMWDRSLIDRFRNGLKMKTYDEIFIGHTTTQVIANDMNHTTPIVFGQPGYGKLFCLDTGAGHLGRLTLMNASTHEFWQSELTEATK